MGVSATPADGMGADSDQPVVGDPSLEVECVPDDEGHLHMVAMDDEDQWLSGEPVEVRL